MSVRAFILATALIVTVMVLTSNTDAMAKCEEQFSTSTCINQLR